MILDLKPARSRLVETALLAQLDRLEILERTEPEKYAEDCLQTAIIIYEIRVHRETEINLKRILDR